MYELKSDIIIKEYLVDGVHHCEDGPSIVYSNGLSVWFKHGKRHRLDGPAVDNHYFINRYYVEGIHITDDIFEWMRENDMRFPLSESDAIQIVLRWA